MKISLKRTWLYRFIPDLSPTSSGTSKGIVCNGITKIGHIDQLPTPLRITWMIFAAIGVLGTLRWLFDFIISSAFYHTLIDNMHSQPNTQDGECLPSDVIDELANRMEMLEVAFKEQVFARETITREITDQSDIYESMDKKFEQLLEKLDNISSLYTELELKYRHLADRIYSDELLGIFIVLILMLQIFYVFRPCVLKSVSKIHPNLTKLINNDKLERKPSSNPGTPKHSISLRNEICIICFHRDNTSDLINKLSDGILRHLDGVKLTVKPFYAIFSMNDVKNIPHVKLYVIMVDLESRGLFINGSEKDLVLMTVKYTKSAGAHCIVVVTNDEGSKNLTAHSTYNSSIRLVKTNDCLQDLASNGKLFSIWQEMTSHQLSHMRRMVKTVLNAKLVMR